MPYFGWALGTLLGAAAGDVLPISITNALGIALYAMFIAIIVPPTIKVRGVAVAVSISIALSCTFYFVPIFSVLSEGFRYIISALIASAVTAAFFPVKSAEEDT